MALEVCFDDMHASRRDRRMTYSCNCMWMGNFHLYIVSVRSVDRRLRGEARFDRRLCLDDAFRIAVHALNIFDDMHASYRECRNK